MFKLHIVLKSHEIQFVSQSLKGFQRTKVKLHIFKQLFCFCCCCSLFCLPTNLLEVQNSSHRCRTLDWLLSMKIAKTQNNERRQELQQQQQKQSKWINNHNTNLPPSQLAKCRLVSWGQVCLLKARQPANQPYTQLQQQHSWLGESTCSTTN